MTTRLIKSSLTEFTDPYIIARYQEDLVADSTTTISIDATSTELFEIELPSNFNEDTPVNQVDTLDGKAYIIKLLSFSISCNSTDYDIRLLNINDISKINTVNELLNVTSINLSYFDQNFQEFIIRNDDNPIQNKLYLNVTNNDTSNETGTITFELTYRPLRSKI